MAEINIKINQIDNITSRLQGLQSECSTPNLPPTTIGGGKTVNELESIANIYKKLNSDLETLVSNTISFFNNVKDSYVSSDIKAAHGMNKK